MIAWLEHEGLRNLEPGRTPLDADLVLVVGANAQGKTSLLEGVYLLATTRSFRASRPRDAIRFGAERMVLRGEVTGPARAAVHLAMELGRERGARRLLVREYPAKLAEYLGFLPVLALAGDTPVRVAASGSERRRLLDRATAVAEAAHLADLAEYRRALAQRNRLLKDGAPDPLLDPWEEILADRGQRIAARRRALVEEWQAHLAEWPALFPEGGRASLRYVEGEMRGARGPAVEREALREALVRGRSRDRKLGWTAAGPHRHDLALEVDGVDLLRMGSAGQARSALAVLMLAQARVAAARRGGWGPVLVLDDVESALDETRLAGLLEAARREGQVIASTAKPELVSEVPALRLVVRAGRIDEVGRD